MDRCIELDIVVRCTESDGALKIGDKLVVRMIDEIRNKLRSSETDSEDRINPITVQRLSENQFRVQGHVWTNRPIKSLAKLLGLAIDTVFDVTPEMTFGFYKPREQYPLVLMGPVPGDPIKIEGPNGGHVFVPGKRTQLGFVR